MTLLMILWYISGVIITLVIVCELSGEVTIGDIAGSLKVGYYEMAN